MENIYDIVVIGGGPSGYSAALYGARSGLNVAVVERISAGGQMTLTGDIDNYPGFNDGIDGFTLGMNMQLGAEKYGAKTIYADVTDVDFLDKIKKITTDSGVIFAKAVIISTGANPRKLGLSNEEALVGKGVHYCAHCDGRFYKDKTVVVVGGGNSAVSDCLYLSKLVKKVYLVHRRDSLRATKIYQKPLSECKNVEFLWNSMVDEFIAGDRLSGVAVKDVKTGITTKIECDGVFVSIGREPATAFLYGKVELDDFGYIIADETTRTNIEGVFASGDVRTKALRQVVTAAADGAVSAYFAEEYLQKL